MCRLSGPTGRFGSEQSDSQRDQCCCPDERMDAFSFRHLLSSFLLGLISFGGRPPGAPPARASAPPPPLPDLPAPCWIALLTAYELALIPSNSNTPRGTSGNSGKLL